MAVYQALTTRPRHWDTKMKKRNRVLRELKVEGRHVSETTQPDRG